MTNPPPMEIATPRPFGENQKDGARNDKSLLKFPQLDEMLGHNNADRQLWKF